MPEETGGPYLSAALLCDTVLEDKSGTLSLIRIVDRLNVSPPPGAPERMPPTPFNTHLVVSFKSGMARGQYTLRITITSPSGAEATHLTLPVLFEGEDRGVNAVVRLEMVLEEYGLFWFGVYLNDVPFTRIPLRVVYHRIGIAG